MAFIEGWPHLRGGLYEGLYPILCTIGVEFDPQWCMHVYNYDVIMVLFSRSHNNS